MTGHATRLAFLLACAGLLGGCPPADGPTYTAPTRDKAAQTSLAVLSAVRWDDIASRLQPDFSLTAAQALDQVVPTTARSEEHTSELQSLMRHSYAVFCLK